MDARRLRRRAFWIGFRSIWDLSGQRTSRELLALAQERRKQAREVDASPWQCGPYTLTASAGSAYWRYDNRWPALPRKG